MIEHLIPRSRTAVALALIGAAVAPRAAQAQAPMLHAACYVPDVGVIYMIRKEGLPSECVAANHIEIAWSDGSGEGGDGTIADGSVTTAKLVDGAVTTAKLTDGAVTTGKVALNAITSAHIVDGSITAADLSGGAVPLANNSVSSDHIVDGSIGSIDLADNSVNTTRIVDGTILAADIGSGQITSTHIANGSIQWADIGSGQINGSHIGSSQITSTHIANGSIQGADIGSSQITSTHIANGSVTASDLHPNAVTLVYDRVSGTSLTLVGGETGSRTVNCGAGYNVVGGGWNFTSGTPTNHYVLVQESFASDDDSWFFRIYNGTAETFTITPQVTCIRVTP